jgi:hypothetical protein
VYIPLGWLNCYWFVIKKTVHCISSPGWVWSGQQLQRWSPSPQHRSHRTECRTVVNHYVSTNQKRAVHPHYKWPIQIQTIQLDYKNVPEDFAWSNIWFSIRKVSMLFFLYIRLSLVFFIAKFYIHFSEINFLDEVLIERLPESFLS